MVLDGDRDKLGEYIRDMANLTGLQDWSFKLASETPPRDDDDPEPYRENSERAACIHIVYGRKFAIVYIAEDWADWTLDDLRQTVVHELMHCHLQGMRWALNNVQSLVPAMTMTVVDGAFRDMCELATDGIATAWATTLPLPVLADDESEEAA